MTPDSANMRTAKITNTSRHPLSDGNPPEWASGWGEDRFGVWAEFSVESSSRGRSGLETNKFDTRNKPVTQRMRWIPQGSFMMGSPEDESGREPFGLSETQHQVTLTKGFWLADTTVSEALWQAVMEEESGKQETGKTLTGKTIAGKRIDLTNENLPKTSISWDDCQDFCKKANNLIPGLKLTLPTEAQWEYACRAGTQTRFSTGNQLTKEHANFNGESPVAIDLFRPNPWGLYQMHGNAWEWCLDEAKDYGSEAEIDPVVDAGEGSDRVLRGGSWIINAQCCRSAYRYRSSRGFRSGSFGLRVAQVTCQ